MRNKESETQPIEEELEEFEAQDDRRWMEEALSLADLAAEQGEVPVGCVVVRDGEILGRGHNRRESWGDPTAHAEILALRDAAQSIGQWRLIGTTVYCTLEPCPMCAGALVNARIDRLVFGCFDPKAGCCGSLYALHQDSRFNHRFAVTSGVCADEAATKLRDFFRSRRKKRKSERT